MVTAQFYFDLLSLSWKIPLHVLWEENKNFHILWERQIHKILLTLHNIQLILMFKIYFKGTNPKLCRMCDLVVNKENFLRNFDWIMMKLHIQKSYNIEIWTVINDLNCLRISVIISFIKQLHFLLFTIKYLCDKEFMVTISKNV